MVEELQVRIYRGPADLWPRFDVYFFKRGLTPDGQEITTYAHEVVAETVVGEGVMVNPSLQLSPQQVQDLMDQLWRDGVRPAAFGGEGHLGALQNHLQDMRKIAFKKLGVE